MEWVETTARTIEEAKELLLDQLGVDEPETEFEILEEPKPGLFGRTKGQARVRARVRPKTPPSRDDRRRRPAKSKDRAEAPASAPAKAAEPKPERKPREDKPAAESSNGRSSESRPARDENVPRLASDVAERESVAFLQGILDTFGATGEITVTIDDEGDLSAEIAGEQLGRLIGPRGGVISAIEELTRTRLQHVASGGSTPRFRLDIGAYRASRRPNLELLVDDVIEKVRSTGQPHVLDVVLAGERKLVHDRVAETATDLQTHSEGEDPVRRVVLSPA
jgi:spoIIIJ-associated protein